MDDCVSVLMNLVSLIEYALQINVKHLKHRISIIPDLTFHELAEKTPTTGSEMNYIEIGQSAVFVTVPSGTDIKYT